MSALAIDALAAAKAAGVALRLKVDEGGLVLEVNAEPPPDVLLRYGPPSPTSCASWRAGRPQKPPQHHCAAGLLCHEGGLRPRLA